MPDHGGNLPTQSVVRAMQLAAAVHDYETLAVHDILNGATRADLHAMAVTLAAMVDIDLTPAQLLAWNDGGLELQRPRPLRPCGTHASFVRHRNNDEEPCEPCWEGERSYQRAAKRRSRQRRLAS